MMFLMRCALVGICMALLVSREMYDKEMGYGISALVGVVAFIVITVLMYRRIYLDSHDDDTEEVAAKISDRQHMFNMIFTDTVIAFLMIMALMYFCGLIKDQEIPLDFMLMLLSGVAVIVMSIYITNKKTNLDSE